MTLPNSASIKTPILQELHAVGGSDDIRFIYERLIAYFPQLNRDEIEQIRTGRNKNWRLAVQKAGKQLDQENLLIRKRGVWTISDSGKEIALTESSGFTLIKKDTDVFSHGEIQMMLIEIGQALGFQAEAEFEYFDVVWRENLKSQRLSHVFEVQSKGNIDSAFAKLKRAFIAQRSKLFLIISTETDLKRAGKSLEREFQDIEKFVHLLTFSQIIKVHQNISGIKGILAEFLEI